MRLIAAHGADPQAPNHLGHAAGAGDDLPEPRFGVPHPLRAQVRGVDARFGQLAPEVTPAAGGGLAAAAAYGFVDGLRAASGFDEQLIGVSRGHCPPLPCDHMSCDRTE
ncbi:hypothetical protein GCM10022420_056220 [Streptomyces iranensis]